jgi:hypothetical protein
VRVAGTWGVVDHCGFVDVGDGVFEVDKLAAEGVLVIGYGPYVGLADSAANHFRCAAVVREGDGGLAVAL